MITGTWNVEYGHEPKRHSQRIMYWFEACAMDVLALTEVRDYIHELAILAKASGHRLLFLRVRPGSDQVAILVRKGLPVHWYRSIVAGRGWFRVDGGAMAPMQPLVAQIDGRVFIASHAPVGAWVVAGRLGRKWIGARLRRIAYRGFVVRLRKVFMQHADKDVICWSDWNASPDTKGIWSPDWLRDQVHGQFIRPNRNTGHGEIDFAIRNSNVHIVQQPKAENPPGWPGDHLCVTAILV